MEKKKGEEIEFIPLPSEGKVSEPANELIKRIAALVRRWMREQTGLEKQDDVIVG